MEKQAIYLDPSFTYAYTLSGHEYIANDDLDKAAVCFRNAIHTDERVLIYTLFYLSKYLIKIIIFMRYNY